MLCCNGIIIEVDESSRNDEGYRAEDISLTLKNDTLNSYSIDLEQLLKNSRTSAKLYFHLRVQHSSGHRYWSRCISKICTDAIKWILS